ncbi:MAG: nuclear transport factor 2 family protein [Acidobacteria bacterium]|nr:nuclear transport factor 2 family protein [Acidobacteriota bacterium]
MQEDELLEHLRSLEMELHRFETRADPKRLAQLLPPDFVEFSRSGRRYSLCDVLAEFSAPGAVLERIHSERFELAEVGDGVALLTYLSAHEDAAGAHYRWSLRSSMWLKVGSGWQMRFHQGTPEDGGEIA